MKQCRILDSGHPLRPAAEPLQLRIPDSLELSSQPGQLQAHLLQGSLGKGGKERRSLAPNLIWCFRTSPHSGPGTPFSQGPAWDSALTQTRGIMAIRCWERLIEQHLGEGA